MFSSSGKRVMIFPGVPQERNRHNDMSTEKQETNTNAKQTSPVTRRDALKSIGTVAAGLAAATTPSMFAADAKSEPCEVKNPYGGEPNSGITFPPYYKPTPSVVNANTFFPQMEELGNDEMRISFIGSTPIPPTRSQSGQTRGHLARKPVGPACSPQPNRRHRRAGHDR